MSLIVDWCTKEAAKFAIERWHYSRTVPKSKTAQIGVWEKGKFIGVVMFGVGATRHLVRPYGLEPKEGCELVRIAMRQHQTEITKIVKISLSLLKKTFPGLRLIVSFADPSQGHHGGIYQGGNWIYTGTTPDYDLFRHKVTNKLYHPRRVGNLSSPSKTVDFSEVNREKTKGKHRYLYPLDKKIRKDIEKLSKTYPKRPKRAMAGSTGTAAV